MKRPLRGAAIVVASLVGFAFTVDLPSTSGGGGAVLPGLSAGVGEARAQNYGQTRRVARRTARRTSHRVARRNSLPAGCVRRGAYWYCGGVYYGQVVEGGATYYIVVNP